MTNTNSPQSHSAAHGMIREHCAQYKAAWLSTSRETIEQFLAARQLESSREQVLVHLIQCEIELRRQAGESPCVEDYSGRFPELEPNVLEELMWLPDPPPGDIDRPVLPPRYQLIKEVGRGGIGAVWRVHDSHFGRSLAAKVLLPRFRGDAAANARLQREALLTGSLQHPEVPPIYDQGQLASGSSYFTMKLVEGQTLAEILSRRQSGDEDRLRMLGMFEKIAQTVAYAHSRGVIHRDLKPQNVMVGRFGEVQIMDWGMAKRLAEAEPPGASRSGAGLSGPIGQELNTADTAVNSTDSSMIEPLGQLTQQGDVFGTPAYMAPEQARGDLDAVSQRSDVFALGAILFEILTGTRLYDDVAGSELMDCLRNGRCQSSLARLDGAGIDDELIELCKECLAPDPEDRPGDAAHVANVISAYASSVEQRLQQAEVDRSKAEVQAAAERRLRRAILASAAVIVLVAVAGLAGIAWQWNNAVVSGKLAERESGRATANFEKLLDAVDRMLTRVGDEKLDQLPHMKTVRRELLQDALAFYQGIVQQEGDSPSLRLEVATAHQRVSKIQYLLGEYVEAKRHTRKAMDLLDSLAGQLPAGQIEPPLAECFDWMGRAESRLGNLAESEDNYLEAIRLHRRLVQGAASRPELVIDLSDSLRSLGTVRKNRGDLEGAAEVLDEATGYLSDLVEQASASSETWLALAACYHTSGLVADKRGQGDQALSLLQQAVGVLTPLVGDDNAADENIKSELSRYLNNLATTCRDQNDPDAAESNHLKAIELRKQLVRDFPNTPEYRDLLAASYINLGVVYKTNDRADEAKRLYVEAIELLESLSREYPRVPEYRSSLGITLHNVANLLEVTERNEQAVEYRRQAISVFDALSQDFPSTPRYQHILGFAQNDLAIQLERRGRSEEALQSVNRAIQIRSDLVERFPETASYQRTLALSRGLCAWILAMSPDESLRDYTRALQLAQASTQTDSKDPNNQRTLGAALLRNARYTDAIRTLKNASIPDHPDPIVHYLLAMAYWHNGDPPQARDLFQKAEQLAANNSGPPDVILSPIQDEAQRLIKSDSP